MNFRLFQILIIALPLLILLQPYPVQAQAQDQPSSKESIFWTWFTQNENKIIGILDDRSFATTLKAKMEEYYPVLTFELGPAEEGKYNFYISCDGLREGLPYVELLGTAAPELPKWNIIKYKQPHKEVTDIMIDGLQLGPKEITVSYTVSIKWIDLKLFIDGFNEKDDRYNHISFLLLDALLGEYAMMTKVGAITFHSSGSVQPSKEIIPFLELKTIVDSL